MAHRSRIQFAKLQKVCRIRISFPRFFVKKLKIYAFDLKMMGCDIKCNGKNVEFAMAFILEILETRLCFCCTLEMLFQKENFLILDVRF